MRKTSKFRRKGIAKLISITVVFGMVSQGFTGVALAKETRAAIAVTVEGTVLVTKAGGSNAYRAFEEMSLSQGDHLKTEDGSSIVLQIVDQEDEITIGPNSDLYISSLLQTDSNAKKSKFKMWAGSVWFKVKKLVSEDDEFEVETPTAVMGVRGSNGYIEAKLGQIYAMMTSGILESQSTTSSSDNEAGGSTTPIYPGQQFTFVEGQDSDIGPTGLDVNEFVKNAPPSVIKKLIESMQAIQEENDAFVRSIQAGEKTVDSKTGLTLTDASVLNKFADNLNNLIGNVAKTAADENKLSKDEIKSLIDKANASITDPNKKLDLNNVKPFDKTVGTDPEAEKAKKELLDKLQKEKLEKQEKEKKELEEKQKRLADLLKKLEEDKKRIEEANKKAQEEQKKKAEELLKQQMDAAAKAAFEAAKAKLEEEKLQQEQQQQQNQQTPSEPTNNNNTGEDPVDSTAPSKPVVRSVPAAVKNPNITITVDAEAGSTVRVKLGSSIRGSASANSSGVANVPITLTNGNNQLSVTATDAAGNESQAATFEVTLDTTLPSASRLIVNNGNTTTSSAEVNLKFLDITEQIVSVIIADNSSFTSAVTKSYDPAGISHTLLANNGTSIVTRDIYVKLVDRAGNESNPFTGNIELLPSSMSGKAVTFTASSDQLTASGDEITLKPNDNLFVNIVLNDLVDAHAVYGAEIHMQYNSALSFHPLHGTDPSFNGNQIFASESSIANIQEYPANEDHIKEIVYTISKYPSAVSGTSGIPVTGFKRLIQIPLLAAPAFDSSEPFTRTLQFEIMLVDNEGEVIFNSVSPILIEILFDGSGAKL